ncbi:MAG TPA: RNA 2',3'-cyclic phosphodiesterase [Pirellulales bacterium]|jgi:2'-5' RNA ligase|nr:RNA 2',3'-cyclic phosphodiesterase [Pirellulales bacterium]
MSVLRVFTAVEITPEVRAQALRLIERLHIAPAKVTWTKADNLHYTLKFLGDVPMEKTAAICQAVQQAAGPFSPFELVAARAGAFPSAGHPRTLWLGVSDGAEQIELLFQVVERLLEPLGFPREHRRFTAHITLGRVRDSSPAALQQLTELLRKHAEFDAGAMPVGSVTVFSSTLGRAGPSYEVLSRAEFEG